MKLVRPEEECGIFGIYNHPEAANLTYLGLYALQHRGQESCGIVSSDGMHLHAHKNMGLVADVFGNQDIFRALPGNAAIGHVRYSTTGSSVRKNVQPIMVDYSRGSIAVAHNGNIVNAQLIKDELEAWGSIFQTTMDTEIIIHLLATSKASSLLDRITEALGRVEGAYCLLFLTENRMVAVRDPNGFRPLCLGKRGDAYVVASESCALDLIEAQFVREIEPGEVVLIDKDGVTSHFPFKKVKPTPCIFEFIYFARPDSIIGGQLIHRVRQALGAELAREHPVDADLVISVPDSATAAAIGYAHAAGIPYGEGLIKNRYIGRTFIEPNDRLRRAGVALKFNTLPQVLEGKRLVVVDDSIVRGNTSGPIIDLLRRAGASEIHMRVSSPPIKHPCFMGVDMATYNELIAHRLSVEEIRRKIGADTLGYLSLEGMIHATNRPAEDYCLSCFTGHYPLDVKRGEAEAVCAAEPGYPARESWRS